MSEFYVAQLEQTQTSDYSELNELQTEPSTMAWYHVIVTAYNEGEDKVTATVQVFHTDRNMPGHIGTCRLADTLYVYNENKIVPSYCGCLKKTTPGLEEQNPEDSNYIDPRILFHVDFDTIGTAQKVSMELRRKLSLSDLAT